MPNRKEPKRMRPQIPNNKGFVIRAYGWFLKLPVPVVLAVCWLAGVVLIGLCALALYVLWLLLVMVEGA